MRPIAKLSSPCLPPQVNTAARMETTSEPGRVHLSESAANFLLRSPVDDLALVSRGSRTIKGKVRRRGARLSTPCHPSTLLPIYREPAASYGAQLTLDPSSPPLLSFQGVMRTFFLAARGGARGHAGHCPPVDEVAASNTAASKTGAAGAAPAVVVAAAVRPAPRPLPRRSLTLADLRLRLRSVEDSAAERRLSGFEAAGGGGGGTADAGNGHEYGDGPPLASLGSFEMRDVAAYASHGVDGGSAAGGSLNGTGTGVSRAGTSSQRRLLTVSVSPDAGMGPPRRPSVTTPPSPGAGYSE